MSRGGSSPLCLKYKLGFQLTVITQPLYVVTLTNKNNIQWLCYDSIEILICTYVMCYEMVVLCYTAEDYGLKCVIYKCFGRLWLY